MIKKYYTWWELQKDCKYLAKLLTDKGLMFDAICAITRGGLIPASILAQLLQIKYIDTYSAHSYKNKKKGTYEEIKQPTIIGRKVLLVDDIMDTGETITKATEILCENKNEVTVIVLHLSKRIKTVALRDTITCHLIEINEWIIYPWEVNDLDDDMYKQLIVKDLLFLVGENPERIGLKQTPKRISAMYDEIFRGYKKLELPKVTTFPNGLDGIIYNQIIIDQGSFYSYCEHHMVPFFGYYYLGYIPDKTLIGLSKIARIVDYFSAKLQIQERLGQEIVDFIQELIKPKGIILQLKARHLCKELRGVKKSGTMMTSIVKGVFEKDFGAREEFYHLIR